MIPLYDDREERQHFIVTATIICLLGIIFLWDRQWQVMGASIIFSDLAARPADILNAVGGGDRGPLLTLFTSMFLHANLAHLISNLVFLLAFGPRVEARFGPALFALFYVFWGVFATIVQIIVIPESGAAMVGASGAIAGVMGSYLLLAPGAKVTVVIPPVFWPFEVPAWIMLGVWFIIQLLVDQPGVATWAHIGGFLGGMLLVLFFRDSISRSEEESSDLVEQSPSA